jgi:uncharacterized membrane protein YfcA
VVAGVPVRSALAAAQPSSVVVAAVGTLGYLARGDVVWSLAALVGVPVVVGVVAGWFAARLLPVRALTWLMVAALLGLAPYLLLRG